MHELRLCIAIRILDLSLQFRRLSITGARDVNCPDRESRNHGDVPVVSSMRVDDVCEFGDMVPHAETQEMLGLIPSKLWKLEKDDDSKGPS